MSLEKVEEKTGIDCSRMDNPDFQISMSQLLQLWQMAVDLTGDPALALHLRADIDLHRMHFVAHIAQNSTNLMEALQHFIRYQRLISDTALFEARVEGKDVILIYTNTSPEHQNIWTPEHNLSSALRYADLFTQSKLFPSEVHFQHADPGYAKEYRKTFRCPVWFEQPEHGLRFKKQGLLKKIAMQNPYLESIFQQHAEEKMRRVLKEPTFRDEVREYILRRLPEGEVNSQVVSKSMHMDRSTLHRKLKQEGTTFKSLLTDTRKDLAQCYIQQGMSQAQIAYLLGYTNPNSFRNAFKSWFGTSPGVFKQTTMDAS